MHSISEKIILNNDQHQHKRTATTNNRINSKIKQQHTTFVAWCYYLRSFVSENGCLLFTSLPFKDNNSLARQTRGIAKKKNNSTFCRASEGRIHKYLFTSYKIYPQTLLSTKLANSSTYPQVHPS